MPKLLSSIQLIPSYATKINGDVKHQFIHIVVDFIEWVIFILITIRNFHVKIIVGVNIIFPVMH